MAVTTDLRTAPEPGSVRRSQFVRSVRVGLASLLALAFVLELMAVAGLALPPHPADAVPEPGLPAGIAGAPIAVIGDRSDWLIAKVHRRNQMRTITSIPHGQLEHTKSAVAPIREDVDGSSDA